MFRCPHCGKAIRPKLLTAAAGRIGGKKTAQRGPKFFRKIQALRKHRRGGRPKKTRPALSHQKAMGLRGKIKLAVDLESSRERPSLTPDR